MPDATACLGQHAGSTDASAPAFLQQGAGRHLPQRHEDAAAQVEGVRGAAAAEHGAPQQLGLRPADNCPSLLPAFQRLLQPHLEPDTTIQPCAHSHSGVLAALAAGLHARHSRLLSAPLLHRQEREGAPEKPILLNPFRNNVPAYIRNRGDIENL